MQDNKYAVVIAGASGVGKTTVADILAASDFGFSFSRSATTRPPRGDGRDEEYYYLTREAFSRLVADGAFVEYTDYGSNCYGTLRSELDRIITDSKIPLLVLDINGVRSFRGANLGYPVYVFYIYEEPSVIRERLYKRDVKHNDSESVRLFGKRMTRNAEDYKSLPEIAGLFDAFVRNDEPNRCAAVILTVLSNLRDSSLAGDYTSEAEAIATHLAIKADDFKL